MAMMFWFWGRGVFVQYMILLLRLFFILTLISIDIDKFEHGGLAGSVESLSAAEKSCASSEFKVSALMSVQPEGIDARKHVFAAAMVM
jgi:hypothetical protein